MDRLTAFGQTACGQIVTSCGQTPRKQTMTDDDSMCKNVIHMQVGCECFSDIFHSSHMRSQDGLC